MNEKRILNVVLAVIAGLLLVNLGVMLSPAAHAIPTTQYRTITLRVYPSQDTAVVLQQALNQQSAGGWAYVGEVSGVLIFKK
ncbi:MAG TPA: hypothetical protein VFS90_19280 [Pyrinomonadaceae bacterium]|nr:hypothetical protein [Pyrinomonadaceae bacterium]